MQAPPAGETAKRGREKIDPITALQEGIDGLSLAMFEALRGLRDAVAPESGNLGNNPNAQQDSANSNNTSTEPDVEELWQLYCNGDATVTELVSNNSSSTTVLKKREDFVQWHAAMERDKDAELVEKLAAAVLLKSEQIDQQVKELPGMDRTREAQMARIQELIEENAVAAQELETVYKTAEERRDDCRKFVREKTSVALGIEEDL